MLDSLIDDVKDCCSTVSPERNSLMNEMCLMLSNFVRSNILSNNANFSSMYLTFNIADCSLYGWEIPRDSFNWILTFLISEFDSSITCGSNVERPSDNNTLNLLFVCSSNNFVVGSRSISENELSIGIKDTSRNIESATAR